MTSKPPDSEDDNHQLPDKNIRQNMSGSSKGNQQIANNAKNVFQLNAPDAKEVYIGNACDFIETEPIINPKDRILHYILILLSLLFYLVVWSVGGLFAQTKFPVEHVFMLLMKCFKSFKDPKELRQSIFDDIKNLKSEDLNKDDNKDSRDEYIRLSQKRDRLFLDKKIIKFIYQITDSSSQTESRIIENIERLEDYLDLDLEPLKREYDPILYKAQQALGALLGDKNAAERDLENIRNSLEFLIDKYNIYSRSASEESFANLIFDLENNIRGNPYSIRKLNLKTLENVHHLLQWSSHLFQSSSREYTALNIQNETLIEPEELIDLDVYDEPQVEFEETIDFYTEDEPQVEHERDVDEKIEIPVSVPTENQNDNKDLQITSSTDFLCSQLEVLLSKTVNESMSTIERLKLGVREQWIKEISVYGFKDYNRHTGGIDFAAMKISLSIDEQYQDRVIAVDGQQVDSLEEAIKQFNLVLTSHIDLTADWRVTYTDPVIADPVLKAHVQETLNLSTANQISWTRMSWLLDITRIRKIIQLPGFSIGIKFGSNNQSSRSINENSDFSGYWLPISVFLFIGVIFFSQFSGFEGNSPVNQPPRIIPPHEETIYLDELHKSISVWDDQSAMENLKILSKSQNLCVVQFSTELQKSIISKGVEGFRNVNPIKRSVNKQESCDLEIVPYEFSP